MGSDRQDFLERKEARLRRKQQADQDAAASRSPSKAGKGQVGPAEQAQKPVFPRRKTAGASSAEETAKTRGVMPAWAERRAQTPAFANTDGRGKNQERGQPQEAKPGQRPAPTPASLPAQQEEQSLIGGLIGRRGAVRRGQRANALPVSDGPKPSLLARVIVWGTMAVCALLILATLGEGWSVHQLNQQVNANQQSANQLQNQNRALATQIAQLQQPETIEKEARQLGYIYPGDQPVVVVTMQPATPTTTTQPAQTPTKSWWGFWPDWLKVFFGG